VDHEVCDAVTVHIALHDRVAVYVLVPQLPKRRREGAIPDEDECVIARAF
jgi:hypothetical protein